jgi:hypothetical protein
VPYELDYASPPLRRALHWDRRRLHALIIWRRLPLPLATIILLVPVYVAFMTGVFDRIPWSRQSFFTFWFLAPMFFAGAIARGRWRDFWVSSAICAGVILLTGALEAARGDYVPYRWLLRTFILTLGFATSEWLGSKSRGRIRFIWMVVAAFGCAAALTIIDTLIRFTGATLTYSLWDGARTTENAETLLHPAIASLLLAATITWSLRIKTAAAKRIVLIAATLAAFVIFAAMFGPMLVPLARHSMRGHGPFSRSYSTMIICLKGREQDTECVFDALDNTRWPDNVDPLAVDWHVSCLEILSNRYPERTAEHFSRLLNESPQPRILEQCAWLFATQHRYEMAPMMLQSCVRALIEAGPFGDAVGSFGALEKMRVPQVAEFILIEHWSVQMAFHPNSPLQLHAEIRKRLTRLLGSDAGADPHDWDDLYQTAIASAPTPLSPQLRSQADAVMTAFNKYAAARNRLAQKGLPISSVAPPNARVKTMDEFTREADAYVSRVENAIVKNNSDAPASH